MRFHARYGPNLILNPTLSRSLHPDTQIFRKDKLHIVSVTDGFVELLSSVQVSLIGHPLGGMSSLTISQSFRKEFWE